MAVETTVRPVLRTERGFFAAMAAAILAAVLLGFARTFFLRPWFEAYSAVHAPRETIFYVKGVFFAAWFVLFFAQASLIATGNRALHKVLGLTAFGLVPVMVVLGTVGSLIAARRPTGFFDIPAPPLEFLIVPLASLWLFGVFAGTALAWRRFPEFHKRLMLLASIVMIEAAIARWPFGFVAITPSAPFWVSTLFLLPLVWRDLTTRGRLHPVTLWGGLVFIAIGVVRDPISHTQAWHSFAQWSVGLLA